MLAALRPILTLAFARKALRGIAPSRDRAQLGVAMQGYHLAELNLGRLLAPTDDPRVARFMAALRRVNGMRKRMPSLVWMMEGSGTPGTGNSKARIGGDPQCVANLTVYESVETLEQFIWNTGHRQFHNRRQD